MLFLIHRCKVAIADTGTRSVAAGRNRAKYLYKPSAPRHPHPSLQPPQLQRTMSASASTSASTSAAAAAVRPALSTVSPARQTYGARAAAFSNAAGASLLRAMEAKRTNLSVSVDVSTAQQLLDVVDAVGPHVCLVKVCSNSNTYGLHILTAFRCRCRHRRCADTHRHSHRLYAGAGGGTASAVRQACAAAHL